MGENASNDFMTNNMNLSTNNMCGKYAKDYRTYWCHELNILNLYDQHFLSGVSSIASLHFLYNVHYVQQFLRAHLLLLSFANKGIISL